MWVYLCNPINNPLCPLLSDLQGQPLCNSDAHVCAPKTTWQLNTVPEDVWPDAWCLFPVVAMPWGWTG